MCDPLYTALSFLEDPEETREYLPHDKAPVVVDLVMGKTTYNSERMIRSPTDEGYLDVIGSDAILNASQKISASALFIKSRELVKTSHEKRRNELNQATPPAETIET